MPRPIVVVGSINIDLVTRTARMPNVGQTVAGTEFQTHSGGKGANQAVAAARLGAPVHLIGRLGDDAFAPILRAALTNDGVNIDAVLPSHGPTGVAVILVADSGENSIIVTPGANALLTPEDLDAQIDTLCSATCVLTQLEIPPATVRHLARICNREGITLILDPAPAVALSQEVLEATAWFTPNETEAAFYLAQFHEETAAPNNARSAGRLLTMGPAGVLLKQGAGGAYLASRGGRAEHISAIPVKAIDSTAAGDTFNGAFAVGIFRGMPPPDAARFATAAAAISVTRAGAQPSMPSLAEVELLLRQQQRSEGHA